MGGGHGKDTTRKSMLYWYVLRNFFPSVAKEDPQKSHQPRALVHKGRGVDEGKLILQADPKFPNSVVKDQQDAVHNLRKQTHLSVCDCSTVHFGVSLGAGAVLVGTCKRVRVCVCVRARGQAFGVPGGRVDQYLT